MKKGLIISALSILLIILVSFIAYQVIDNNLKNLLKQDVSEISLNKLDDGKYIGEYQVFPINVKVEVEVENHQIKGIVLLKHDNGQGSSAESIIHSVIVSNSINVDVISGASYSSKVILNAISNALNQK